MSWWARSPLGSRVVVVISRRYLTSVQVFVFLHTFRKILNRNSRGQDRAACVRGALHGLTVPSLFRQTAISTGK